MSAFTVDASTFLALLIPEAHSRAVGAFFRGLSTEDELVMPSLFLAECTSNIRRKVYQGVLPEPDARHSLRQLLAVPVRQVSNKDQHEIAFNLASQRGKVRAYDEHYLAVAVLEGTEIVTIDGGMYQGAIENRIPARLLR